MTHMLNTGWWPFVSDHQGWPPNILPAPGDFSASLTAEIIFFFVAGAAVVIFAVPWAVRAAVRSRNYVPLIVMTSGLICSLLEPMLEGIVAMGADSVAPGSDAQLELDERVDIAAADRLERLLGLAQAPLETTDGRRGVRFVRCSRPGPGQHWAHAASAQSQRGA